MEKTGVLPHVTLKSFGSLAESFPTSKYHEMLYNCPGSVESVWLMKPSLPTGPNDAKSLPLFATTVKPGIALPWANMSTVLPDNPQPEKPISNPQSETRLPPIGSHRLGGSGTNDLIGRLFALANVAANMGAARTTTNRNFDMGCARAFLSSMDFRPQDYAKSTFFWLLSMRSRPNCTGSSTYQGGPTRSMRPQTGIIG